MIEILAVILPWRLSFALMLALFGGLFAVLGDEYVAVPLFVGAGALFYSWIYSRVANAESNEADDRTYERW